MYSVKFSWLIENCILLVEPVGDFEVSVALAAIEQFRNLLDELPHRIHVVINLTSVRTPVKDPKVLGSSCNRLRCHPNLGSTVFISNTSMSRIGGELFGRFLGTRYSVVSTMEQALLTLERFDLTSGHFRLDRQAV